MAAERSRSDGEDVGRLGGSVPNRGRGVKRDPLEHLDRLTFRRPHQCSGALTCVFTCVLAYAVTPCTGLVTSFSEDLPKRSKEGVELE